MNRLDHLYRQRAELAAQIHAEETAQATTPISTGTILNEAAELYGVTIEQLLSNSREYRVVRARQAACWLLRGYGLSFPRIGAIVSRDHTTVMHACGRVDNDPAVRAMLWPILTRTTAA